MQDVVMRLREQLAACEERERQLREALADLVHQVNYGTVSAQLDSAERAAALGRA